MLAAVNPFWITSDISSYSIVFMLAVIFSNLWVYVIVFDDITYLCMFTWAYFAKLLDSRYRLPQRRKLKQLAEFLKKHQLRIHEAHRIPLVFAPKTLCWRNQKAMFGRAERCEAFTKRCYFNVQIQTKNMRFIHNLIKRIVATNSVWRDFFVAMHFIETVPM